MPNAGQVADFFNSHGIDSTGHVTNAPWAVGGG